jgi:hypothetical protein
MGFKKPLDVNDVKLQLIQAHSEICSPYNDGFIQWELKKEIYGIKFLLEEMLKRQPAFNDEEKWLEEEHKKRVWSELKR